MTKSAGPWTARAKLREFSQYFEDLRVLRRFGDVVHVDVTHDAFFIDDDDGALADAFVFFPDAVLLRHFTFRMEVGEERIFLDTAEGFCECYVAGNAVNRDAHDLGIIPFKVGDFRLISRHLDRSDRCPRSEEHTSELQSRLVIS